MPSLNSKDSLRPPKGVIETHKDPKMLTETQRDSQKPLEISIEPHGDLERHRETASDTKRIIEAHRYPKSPTRPTKATETQ